MKLFDYETDVVIEKSMSADSNKGYEHFHNKVPDQRFHGHERNRYHSGNDGRVPDGHHSRNDGRVPDGHHSRNDGRVPNGPPPKMIPKYSKSAGMYAVSPGSIKGCMYSYTHVWLANGRSFWFYPTFVSRKSVSGYRWSRFGWSYVGLDLDMIEYFSCAKY